MWATTCCVLGGIIPLHVGQVKERSRAYRQADNRTGTVEHESGYCIDCGAQLEAAHRFCWSCGAQRWTEPGTGPAEEGRPPPTPGTPVFTGRPPPAEPARAPVTGLGLLPWFYAAGAILFLIEATQGTAYLLSPGGRAQLAAELTRQGVAPAVQRGILTAYWIILIGGSLVAAALHGTAFYGLRRLRRWGWIAAVVVAALWSLLIVGIPVLVRLVSRNVRQAFGVD
jgi:putative hemolysin